MMTAPSGIRPAFFGLGPMPGLLRRRCRSLAEADGQTDGADWTGRPVATTLDDRIPAHARIRGNHLVRPQTGGFWRSSRRGDLLGLAAGQLSGRYGLKRRCRTSPRLRRIPGILGDGRGGRRW